LIHQALAAIPADKNNDWLAIGMALAGMGDRWFEVWDKWSSTADSYKPEEMSSRWKSFKGKKGDPDLILGIAKKYGFKASRQVAWRCLPSDQYQIGAWSGEVFTPKTDFDFTVTKKIASSQGGGLFLEVERVQKDQLMRQGVFISSADLGETKAFAAALRKQLGYNIACTLRSDDLQALIQNRTAKYELEGGKTFKLADRVGQQNDGYWVFENCQFKPDGTPTNENESLWVFNHQLGENEKVPSPVIAHQDPESLSRLIESCRGFFHPETLPLVWFNCGYSVATMHRQVVMSKERCFPQLSTFGDPGGAKTTAALTAASLAGMHTEKCIINKFSESLIYEQLKSLGGLPVVLDDPIKKGKGNRKADTREEVDNLLWSLYNGAARKVRGNEQAPHSSVIVSSNVALGEDSQAIESRLLKIYYPVRTQNDAGFPALEEAMNGASGAFSQLIAIGYDREAVKDIRSRLLEHLSGAHSRISSSYALLIFFTQKFCDLAGIAFDAFQYCVENLCDPAREAGNDKSSLDDFIEKLAILKREGKVGEWNITQTIRRSDGARWLAVDLLAVFPVFQSLFSPNYSLQTIRNLIRGEGGDYHPVKLGNSKQEWQDYNRALAAFHRGEVSKKPTTPSKSSQQRCNRIPQAVIDRVFGHNASSPAESPLTTMFSAVPTFDDIEGQPEQAKTATAEEPIYQVKEGDQAVVVQDTKEGLKSGQKVKVTQVRLSNPTAANPTPLPYAVVAALGAQSSPRSVWIQNLRPLTAEESVGNWGA
jgi:hypothetical protein